LDAVQIFDGKKYLILDDIIELGPKAFEIHTKLAKNIAKYNLEKIILVGKNYAVLLKSGLIDNGFAEDRILISKHFSLEKQEFLSSLSGTSNTLLLLGFQTTSWI